MACCDLIRFTIRSWSGTHIPGSAYRNACYYGKDGCIIFLLRYEEEPLYPQGKLAKHNSGWFRRKAADDRRGQYILYKEGHISTDEAQAPIGQRQPVTGIPPVMPSEGNVRPIIFTAEFNDMKMPARFKTQMKNRLFSADTSYKNYPLPYDEETPYDESTYYALITLKPGTGAIESERVIKMADPSCTGIVDGKFAVAYPVKGSDANQTMKMYDPLSESSDVTYEINAGLSNEDDFTGGGDGTIKKVGDNIAIAPDGYSWIVLTPAGSSTITG